MIRKQKQLNLIYFREVKNTEKTMLFLHGFTGKASDCQFLTERLNTKYNIAAIDLPGHGLSASLDEEDYTPERLPALIHETLERNYVNRPVIYGYSMGGRAALLYARKYPDNISGLVLENAGAGIMDPGERKNRIHADNELAGQIIDNGLEWFVEYWMNLPLFESLKSLPESDYTKLKNSKKDNSSEGLALSLIKFGAGRMPYFHDSIKKFPFPLLLLAGEKDRKYSELYEELKINKTLHKKFFFTGAGHNIHYEKPDKFAEILNQFLISDIR